MPRKKGCEKTGGRKPGTPNKRTAEQRKRIENILNLSIFSEQQIEKDLKAIDAKERLDIFIKLQEYITPKLARTELTGKEGEGLTINLGFGIESVNKSNLPGGDTE